ncbi:sugar transferase [Marixanthomonas spongiae]|uniref:Sugar transferase n=1 Tax=Marixanthomonas spongiae TaxID=2174845 RepID=A0A2U0I3R4_9FLAO|nr:sugar transferase [Marixanthomonas spongiae]PVW15752.1 sugar transferase [Marixanthomonas spongiae]
MKKNQLILKRFFDFLFSILGLVITFPFILIFYLIVFFTSQQNGLYKSTRIGQHGHPFTMWKLRTMRPHPTLNTTVTSSRDIRITPFGRLLRRTKLDELPQLWNVLKGDMSLVGPRPDVPGFADQLQGDDRKILSVRPGITGLATLAFRDEEVVLANQTDPERYNREVIWPEKVRLNRYYLEHYSLSLDFNILFKTVFGGTISVTKKSYPTKT